MKLDDLITDDGLLQDEFSLSGVTFNSSEIVGWSGKQHTGKFYILRCPICANDPEMYQEGYFRSLKSNLTKGQVPCGCGKGHRYSPHQFATLCARKAEELGYRFVDFTGEWKGARTKIRVSCDVHGEWNTGMVYSLINGERGCPRCFADAFGLRMSVPDHIMIDSFFASGSFSETTEFWRSERRTKQGSKSYWYVYCPDCDTQGESMSNNLQQGKKPCKCSVHRQQECYINWLVDEHGNAVAIKFGIANNSKQRIKKQGLHSVYALKQHAVYTFPSVQQCKQAERECKKELECGVVLKRDMPDGWTETTWSYNIGKVIDIYKRNGGVLV